MKNINSNRKVKLFFSLEGNFRTYARLLEGEKGRKKRRASYL
jgi:hypothetical protein